MQVNRTRLLRLGSQPAPGLRRSRRCLPVWRACLRLAPAARLPAHVAGLSPDSCRKLRPPAVPSDSILGLRRESNLPALPPIGPPAFTGRAIFQLLRWTGYGLAPAPSSFGAAEAEPPAFTGRRISSLRWRPASVFRQKPGLSSFPGLLAPGLRRIPSPPVPLAD